MQTPPRAKPLPKDDVNAVLLAAELVRAPSILASFLTATNRQADKHQPAADLIAATAQAAGIPGLEAVRSFPAELAATSKALLEIPPSEWARSFSAALRNAKFVDFLKAARKQGRSHFPSKTPESVFARDSGLAVPEDPLAQILQGGHHRLMADPEEPRWFALGIFCLARLIAVTTRNGYEAMEWDDFTFAGFDLEKTFLAGDGAAFARALLKVNRTFFNGRMAEYVGQHMYQGFVEAAVAAPESSFFRCAVSH